MQEKARTGTIADGNTLVAMRGVAWRFARSVRGERTAAACRVGSDDALLLCCG